MPSLDTSDLLADETVMLEECRPNVMLTNNDDCEDDTSLWLNLVFRWPDSEFYDEVDD